MSESAIIGHVVTAISTAVGTATTFAIVLRIMWQKIGENHAVLKKQIDDHETADEALFTKLDAKKQDKPLCEKEHQRVDKELNDGRDKFRDILEKQDRTTDEVRGLVTQIALIAQRLEFVLPTIEAMHKRALNLPAGAAK